MPEPIKPPKFIAIKSTVMVATSGKCITRAASSTLARRIAAALNRYVPGPKGY